MYSFQTDDVNQALQYGLEYLRHAGVEEQSRNGPVLVAPGPVCTEYTNPRSRVLFSPTRDANPFFHLMESLWMLSGANDVEFVEFFAKQMREYSDDGITSWGAYGWRWRSFFGWDQLEGIVAELQKNPASRRCVLAMWNAVPDPELVGLSVLPKVGDMDASDFYVATHGGLDVPCNTHAYVDCRGGALNITVCNRSNDIVWGCYGANAVHFSFLQEYMAMRVGVPIGTYRQFSNNFHLYTGVFGAEKIDQIIHECDTLGALPELGPALEPGFDADLGRFMPWARAVIRSTAQEPIALNVPDLKTPFMHAVVVPVFLAWTYRKWKDKHSMGVCLDGIDAPDWKRACQEWVSRRTK